MMPVLLLLSILNIRCLGIDVGLGYLMVFDLLIFLIVSRYAFAKYLDRRLLCASMVVLAASIWLLSWNFLFPALILVDGQQKNNWRAATDKYTLLIQGVVLILGIVFGYVAALASENKKITRRSAGF